MTAELGERITQMIESGILAPGQRLPPEHALIASFQVSRSVLREAIATLRAEGLLVSRRGSGVFVAQDQGRRPFRIREEDLGSARSVIDILELRASVEIEAAGLAAERRSETQARRISAAFARINAEMKRGSPGVDADFEFHRAIAEATNNPQFPKFLDYLGRLLIPRQRLRIETDEGRADPVAYLRLIQEEHHAIERAIVGRDAAAARASMRTHLLVGADGRLRRWVEQIEARERGG
jgi:DNA-binding FadR family transcriptional regulator